MVRKATTADIPAILALISANSDKLLSRTTAELSELIDTTWVVERDGGIAGCCCLEVYSAKIAEIRTLAVDDRYRGHGLGRQLVEVAIEEAKRRHIPQILTVTSNREFFGKLNFGPCLNEKYALFWNGR